MADSPLLGVHWRWGDAQLETADGSEGLLSVLGLIFREIF